MRPLRVLPLLALLGCAHSYALEDYSLALGDNGGLTVTRSDGKVLVEDLLFGTGTGDEVIEMQEGSYRVASGSSTYGGTTAARGTNAGGVWQFPLEGASGDAGTVEVGVFDDGVLYFGVAGDGDRVRWDAACTGDDHFAGLGQMQQDVDHVGEAFPLWVSEPGIGKTTDDVPPDDWFLTGTKHATSYPDPFLVRPEPVGLVVDTDARVEVDLCTGDRWRMDAWVGAAQYLLIDGDTPLDVVEKHALLGGPLPTPPTWALAPWNDAVGGADRVRTVVSELRSAGASSSVIWTEDWKGAEEGAFGYRLLNDWTMDEALYPDPAGIDAELEAAGFKWLAYFSPFLATDADVWEEGKEYTATTAAGDPYLFTGVTFEDTAILDLTRPDAQEWAAGKMQAAAAFGFDGWMADYGEWVPPDAQFAGGDAVANHNAYPLWWQETNELAFDGITGSANDMLFFTRSGWITSNTHVRAAWGGDQRTSFDADDGFPTVVPISIGAGLSGVGYFGTDIAGYQSVGNAPSTKELWFRWCELGAFSPIMRTHHGAFKDDNWQFDSDAETLAHYARYGNLHAELYPYLRGLGRQYRDAGTPMILAPFLQYPSEPWGRTDAYMLGSALFVAPVLTEGATSLALSLPDGPTWYDFWTGVVTVSGTVPAPLDTIPVYAPAGAIVPMFAEAPESLVTDRVDGVRTIVDADPARVVRVYAGAAGSFAEEDGTTYSMDGNATGPGTATATLTSGTIEAGGLTLSIQGPYERTYTVEVVAP